MQSRSGSEPSRAAGGIVSVRTVRAALLAAAACAVACARAAAPAVPTTDASLPPVEVRDLAYGDVLFYFFQDDYFNSLTRLRVAQEEGKLPHHEADAELLEGGLYLSLGQHREAGEIFERVLDRKGVPAAVRDRARFYLGKVWYQRGYLDKAIPVLSQTGGGTLPPDMDAERRLILADALIVRGRNDEAVEVLRNFKGSKTWTAYAGFNRGVALVRGGHLDEGLRDLELVGKLAPSGAEGVALRDRANLAIGYALLQANRPAEAEAALDRVRLNGPYSTRALLGAGWAESAKGQYQEALTPWLELRGRNLLDPAVQESYLAVPFAFAKLGANGQAAEYYESAVREFEAEDARIDESIEAIRQGKLVDAIVRSDVKGGMGLGWHLAKLPDSPESRYLYQLLARNEFQEGLKNYRQLLYAQNNLDAWADNLDAYDNMIATRRYRYEHEVPEARARLARTDLEALRNRRTSIESRLAAAESSGDVVALGTSHERATYAKVEQLDGIAADSGDPDALDDREKLRLMKGVLYWQMHQAFKARAWAVRKNERETQQALREAEIRWAQVTEAEGSVPNRDEDFARRVVDLGGRVHAAQADVRRLQAVEAGYLSSLAVDELRAQRNRLDAYLIQARYALATLYDRAADDRSRSEAHPARPAESPEATP